MPNLFKYLIQNNNRDHDQYNYFQPGTTTILLPFTELHAERGRIDELQHKRLAGALSFENQGSSWLSNNLGNYGLFAI